MKLTRVALALGALTCLFAYLGRVEWEEEVQLNTGERLWVTRSVFYSPAGAGGNPMDIGLRPGWEERTSFIYNGRKYSYKGDADLMLLAISPKRQPVLVAPAANKSWDWNHNFYCAKPHYVQLTPDQSGTSWNWPDQIEPWTYGLKGNLMRKRYKWGHTKQRYTIEDIDVRRCSRSDAVPSKRHCRSDICQGPARMCKEASIVVVRSLLPNPSFKRSPNSVAPGPRGSVVYHLPHGPGATLSVPA